MDVTSDTGDDDVQEETHTTAEACRLKAQKKYLERDNCLKHLTETDCLKHNKYCEWEDSVCLSTTKFVAEYSVYDGKDQEISNNGLADTHDKPMMLSRCKIREISRHSEIPSAAPWFIFDNWDGLAFDGHENNSWYSYRTYLASDPAHPEFENSCSHLSSLEGPCKERSECVWTAAKDGIASRCDPKPVGLGKCYHHLKNTTAMKKHGMSEITFDIPSLTIPRDTRTMVDEHYCVEKDYYVVVDDGWCTIPFESEKLPVIEHLQTAECRLAPILMPFEEPKLPIIIDGVFYNNMVGRDKVGPCERTNWGGHCMGDECQCQPGSSHACDSQSGTRTPVHGADRDTEEEEINYDVVQNLMGRENVQIWKSYESEADCKAALESYHHTSYEELRADNKARTDAKIGQNADMCEFNGFAPIESEAACARAGVKLGYLDEQSNRSECMSENYSKENPCKEWLSEYGWCGNTDEHKNNGIDCTRPGISGASTETGSVCYTDDAGTIKFGEKPTTDTKWYQVCGNNTEKFKQKIRLAELEWGGSVKDSSKPDKCILDKNTKQVKWNTNNNYNNECGLNHSPCMCHLSFNYRAPAWPCEELPFGYK